MNKYEAELVERLWDYRDRLFGDRTELFDGYERSSSRPPVFVAEHADHNVLTAPDAEPATRERVIGRVAARHRWFASMKSSQAIAQSVFANLAEYERLDLLQDITDNEFPVFFERAPNPREVVLEFEVDYLGEPRPTSVDVLIPGAAYRTAVECKLTEPDISPCSRPKLALEGPGYCSGSYERQNGRASRCSLAEIGVKYWEYVPDLFDWATDVDHAACPLRFTYQLVRNVLAACVRDGRADAANGHAALVYDARSPAFAPGGSGHEAWRQTRAALRDKSLLRRCTWQSVAERLRADDSLRWLGDGLADKYGI